MSAPFADDVPQAIASSTPQDRKTGWVTIKVLTPVLDKKNRIVFVHQRNDPDLTTHLGDGPAEITDGYGGWNQVPRPRRKPMTQWEGGKDFTMSVPILLSGWFNESSVESRVRRLEQMARAAGGNDEPPPVQILLPADSPRDDGYVWVIDNIEWGASRRRRDGARIYQEATLTCIEYVRPDIVKLSPAKARRQQAQKKPKKNTTRSKLKKKK